MLMYHNDELVPLRYIDLDLPFNRDSHKSTFKFVFALGHGIFNWRSMKQFYIANFTIKVESVTVSKAIKEVV